MASSRTILVVDDDPLIREALRICLEVEGYAVHAAENGQAAVDALDYGLRPDAILLDWMMPVMNGLEFLEAYRARPEWQHMRVVIVSSHQGYSAEELRGAFRVLRKPLDLAVLCEELEHALTS